MPHSASMHNRISYTYLYRCIFSSAAAINQQTCVVAGILSAAYRHKLRLKSGSIGQATSTEHVFKQPSPATPLILTPSTPAGPSCCCSRGLAPYRSNPLFLIFDIRALLCSALSARAPECQN